MKPQCVFDLPLLCGHSSLQFPISPYTQVVPGILQETGKVSNPWPNVDAHSGVLLQVRCACVRVCVCACVRPHMHTCHLSSMWYTVIVNWDVVTLGLSVIQPQNSQLKLSYYVHPTLPHTLNEQTQHHPTFNHPHSPLLPPFSSTMA